MQRPLSAVLALLLSTGCYSYSRVERDQLSPHSVIRLSAPRGDSLQIRSAANGDLPGAWTRAEGRLKGVSGDTVSFASPALTGDRRGVHVERSGVSVPFREGQQIERRRFDAARTSLLIIPVLVLALLLAGDSMDVAPSGPVW